MAVGIPSCGGESASSEWFDEVGLSWRGVVIVGSG